jgi:hypothetical protein
MKVGISINIDVTKIDKARIVEGKKGKYIDVTAFIDLDEQDEYGNNGMVTQNVTKEEREAKVRGPILGNAKVFYRDEGQQQARPKPPRQSTVERDPFAGEDFDDSQIPFIIAPTTVIIVAVPIRCRTIIG